MNATKRLSVAAVMAVLALLGATLVGGVADAKKKKKGPKRITKTVRGQVPDSQETCVDKDGDGVVDCSDNGGEYKNGILAKRFKVPGASGGAKGASASALRVRSIQLQVSATGNDVGDLDMWLIGPNGKWVNLKSCCYENHPPGTVFPPTDTFGSAGRFGPALFDDKAPMFINDTNSCPNLANEMAPGDCTPADTRGDGGGVEAFAPYAGSFKPEDGTMASLGRRLTGDLWFIARDNDPPNTCGPPACPSGDPADVQSVTAKLIITPKGK